MYYEQQQPPDDAEKPPGCMDVLIITRVVFGVLLWPLVAMIAVVVLASVAFFLFVTWPPLALIPVAIALVAVWLFARWEQRRYRPPDV